MFGFAWSGEYNSVHWFVPTFFGALLGSSLLLIFVGFLNYLVDTYLMYAASAIAANTIARSACGAAAPLFTHQMFTALGVGGGELDARFLIVGSDLVGAAGSPRRSCRRAVAVPIIVAPCIQALFVV